MYAFICNYLEDDRPNLKDLVTFVVPKVHHKWYNLGLQLLYSKEKTFLHSLRTQYYNSLYQCTEVFVRWLESSENPKWDDILNALTTKSVELPNVADYIKKMLSNPEVRTM